MDSLDIRLDGHQLAKLSMERWVQREWEQRGLVQLGLVPMCCSMDNLDSRLVEHHLDIYVCSKQKKKSKKLVQISEEFVRKFPKKCK